ncbi:MAG: RpiB/LacA/LacB family sugar-phosphate isomerase [Chloroflexota bacterium]|nr:RpiB/LacA/LacB family sugar-phosphate isomerase [Chloroflexota bacterium]
MTRRVAIAADHGGYPLKVELAAWLQDGGYDVVDLGAHELDPLDDYPDFANAVAEAIVSGQVERAIVFCGSGAGASIAANKVPGVRAAVCHDTYSAHQAVEHDDMNILCIGARVVGGEVARELVTAFLAADLLDDPKYHRRLAKVAAIEQRSIK